MSRRNRTLPYRESLAGALLIAREAVMTPIRPFLNAAGVTEQQWRVLRVLIDDGPIDISELAAAALLHAPSLTRILSGLVDAKLVTRKTDVKDKRRSIISVSGHGRDLVRKTTLEAAATHNSFAGQFGTGRLTKLRLELLAFSRAMGGAKTNDRKSRRGRVDTTLSVDGVFSPAAFISIPRRPSSFRRS